MEQYELIGYPLGHSLSPEIHTALFALDGLEASYQLDAFPPEELEARVPYLKTLAGFNITIPYKRAILPYLDGLADSARLYGAVNTVQHKDGRYVGHNTDCDGFLHTMRAHGIPLKTDVCVLGAGGVGRMFAIECARQGARVTLAVRESGRQKAEELAAEIRKKLGTRIAIREIASLDGPYGLLINATPVGMYPKTGVSPVDAALLRRVDAVFDCIYNPTETRLLADAKAAGCRLAGGMDMLVWQAAAAHQIWNGRRYTDAQIAALIARMEEALLQRERSE